MARLLLEFGHDYFSYQDENGEERQINVAAVIIDQLEMDHLVFENPVYHQIYKHFEEAVDGGEFKKISYFVNHPNQKVAKFCIEVLSNAYDLSPNWMDKKQIYVKSEKDHLKMSVLNSILSYKQRVLEKNIQDLRKQLKNATEDEVMKIIKRIAKKENQKKLISKELGRTVLW